MDSPQSSPLNDSLSNNSDFSDSFDIISIDSLEDGDNRDNFILPLKLQISDYFDCNNRQKFPDSQHSTAVNTTDILPSTQKNSLLPILITPSQELQKNPEQPLHFAVNTAMIANSLEKSSTFTRQRILNQYVLTGRPRITVQQIARALETKSTSHILKTKSRTLKPHPISVISDIYGPSSSLLQRNLSYATRLKKIDTLLATRLASPLSPQKKTVKANKHYLTPQQVAQLKYHGPPPLPLAAKAVILQNELDKIHFVEGYYNNVQHEQPEKLSSSQNTLTTDIKNIENTPHTEITNDENIGKPSEEQHAGIIQETPLYHDIGINQNVDNEYDSIKPRLVLPKHHTFENLRKTGVLHKLKGFFTNRAKNVYVEPHEAQYHHIPLSLPPPPPVYDEFGNEKEALDNKNTPQQDDGEDQVIEMNAFCNDDTELQDHQDITHEKELMSYEEAIATSKPSSSQPTTTIQLNIRPQTYISDDSVLLRYLNSCVKANITSNQNNQNKEHEIDYLVVYLAYLHVLNKFYHVNNTIIAPNIPIEQIYDELTTSSALSTSSNHTAVPCEITFTITNTDVTVKSILSLILQTYDLPTELNFLNLSLITQNIDDSYTTTSLKKSTKISSLTNSDTNPNVPLSLRLAIEFQINPRKEEYFNAILPFVVLNSQYNQSDSPRKAFSHHSKDYLKVKKQLISSLEDFVEFRHQQIKQHRIDLQTSYIHSYNNSHISFQKLHKISITPTPLLLKYLQQSSSSSFAQKVFHNNAGHTQSISTETTAADILNYYTSMLHLKIASLDDPSNEHPKLNLLVFDASNNQLSTIAPKVKLVPTLVLRYLQSGLTIPANFVILLSVVDSNNHSISSPSSFGSSSLTTNSHNNNTLEYISTKHLIQQLSAYQNIVEQDYDQLKLFNAAQPSLTNTNANKSTTSQYRVKIVIEHHQQEPQSSQTQRLAFKVSSSTHVIALKESIRTSLKTTSPISPSLNNILLSINPSPDINTTSSMTPKNSGIILANFSALARYVAHISGETMHLKCYLRD